MSDETTTYSMPGHTWPEFDYVNTREKMYLEIANSFGIPKTLIGHLSETNYASSRNYDALELAIMGMQKQVDQYQQIKCIWHLGKKVDFLKGTIHYQSRSVFGFRDKCDWIYRPIEEVRVTAKFEYRPGIEDWTHEPIKHKFFVVNHCDALIECLADKCDITMDYDFPNAEDLAWTDVEFRGHIVDFPRRLGAADIAQKESSVMDTTTAAMYSDWLEERNWTSRAEEIRQKWDV